MESQTETLVRDFLRSILEVGKLEQTFASITKSSPATDLYNRTFREKRLGGLLVQLRERDDPTATTRGSSSSTGEHTALAVHFIVDRLSNIANSTQSAMLCSLLEHAIRQNSLPARIVLESILLHRNFTIDKEVFWQRGLNLMERTIHLVDYKGVRDLLKILIDKVLTLPQSLPVSIISNAECLYRVFKMILNREKCLLPAYLVLDEIQKKVQQSRTTLHWKFSSLIVSFIESFKPVTQLVTICNRPRLVPVVGFSSSLPTTGSKLDASAKFTLKGLLPYDRELLEPQSELLFYILSQPYSRDLICQMLGLTTKHKQRCPFLEEQLVELICKAMQESRKDLLLDPGTIYLWQHLSTHLIYFVLFHHASFPHMVRNLCTKLSDRNLSGPGREHLFWILLQFISGSIQKNPLKDFLPILDLYNLLYPERSPLPIPDITKATSVHAFAAASIWIHLCKKAETEPSQTLGRRVPVALENHVSYLQKGFPSDSLPASLGADFRVAILCNAYSTNQEQFSRPMAVLVEAALGNRNTSSTSSVAASSSVPIPLTLLDSLTVHTKMSLIHAIPGHINKTCQNAAMANKGNSCAGPATKLSSSFLETYSRLLIYSEIESLGIKGFMNQLLNSPPLQWRSAPNIYHSLLEMFAFRLHHVPNHYRIQLLIHLNSPATVLQTSAHVQLYLCGEHTVMRLLLGLSSMECLTLPQYTRFSSDSTTSSSSSSSKMVGYKQMISCDSEELNKILVLCLSRAIVLTHSDSISAFVKALLTDIHACTPITWPSFTLSSFPKSIAEFYNHCNSFPNHQRENKSQLKQMVNEEYRKWKMMNNENDIVAHFSHASNNTQHLFLCLIWKMILEQEASPIRRTAFTILDRIGSRLVLNSHLRSFADYLVVEFANSGVTGAQVTKYMDALNSMIWKYHIIPLDRLVLTLALRPFERDEAAVCLFLILKLLLTVEFKSRVNEFSKEYLFGHWEQSEWQEKHQRFLSKFPEKYYFDNLHESTGQHHKYISVYFHNVCLRFIPVMDIVIHRFIEHSYGAASNSSTTTISPENILDSLGVHLYKFHDRPLTYLYGTLFYYCEKLQDRDSLKRKLVSVILGAQSLKSSEKDTTFLSMLSDQFSAHLSNPEECPWNPNLEYYRRLVFRLKETMIGNSKFSHFDWRFNEFVNVSSLALHLTCIELMASPTPPYKVANSLFDIVTNYRIPRTELHQWVNAIGILLTALPEPYWTVLLFDRILSVMRDDIVELFERSHHSIDVLQMMAINPNQELSTQDTPPLSTRASLSLLIAHSFLYHAPVGTVCLLPLFLKRAKTIIVTEDQLLFICLVVCPFFQRLSFEKTRCVMDCTIEIYEMLAIVDGKTQNLNYDKIDPIVDLLYHCKYQFLGDSIKQEIETSILKMRPSLREKLRFITHLNREEIVT